jgi:hypothetical protein
MGFRRRHISLSAQLYQVGAGPTVRILLPPAASQERTVRLLEIERITGSNAATPGRFRVRLPLG